MAQALSLEDFKITKERGFLPKIDPLRRLPGDTFAAWEDVASSLPKLLASTRLRSVVENLPKFPVNELKSAAEIERAMVALSFIGHAYVFTGTSPATKLPPILSIPWYEVAEKLGRPPVLSYASYALNNWHRIDKSGPVEAGNIALNTNFWGGVDEEWFVIVHVDIEAKAPQAIVGIVNALNSAAKNDERGVNAALAQVATSLQSIYTALSRMPEYCDPYAYYTRVRPWIHGWKDSSVLPDGLIYEGVAPYNGQPQKFRGETGAQSTLIPAIDAALRITHGDDPLRRFLLEMPDYMPKDHRAFLRALEATPGLRVFVDQNPTLKQTYNECVEWVARFRTKHLEFARDYIQAQRQSSPNNPTEVGTGGTPFYNYLKKHRDESASQKA